MEVEVKKLAEEEFLRIPGVVGVSVGQHSEKKVRIYVERKDVVLMREIPKKFLGYEVEVVEVGTIKPLITTEERRLRWRPIFPGISIGSVKITAGTLTGIAIDKDDGEYVLLSNYHVFWGDAGERIVQPGPYDGGTIKDTVGFLKRYSPVYSTAKNYLDSAIATCDVDFDATEPELGKPVGVRDAVMLEVLVKAGRSTGVTRGSVLDTSATVKVVDYPGIGTAVFEDVIVTSYMAAPGDSGSPAFAVLDGNWVGQVFAGSEKITCMIKATRIVQRLRITPILGMPTITMGFGMFPLLIMAAASILR